VVTASPDLHERFDLVSMRPIVRQEPEARAIEQA
jgi:hypothetical protein